MVYYRNLSRAEIEQIWSIDRSEIIENIYFYENIGIAGIVDLGNVGAY